MPLVQLRSRKQGAADATPQGEISKLLTGQLSVLPVASPPAVSSAPSCIGKTEATMRT